MKVALRKLSVRLFSEALKAIERVDLNKFLLLLRISGSEMKFLSLDKVFCSIAFTFVVLTSSIPSNSFASEGPYPGVPGTLCSSFLEITSNTNPLSYDTHRRFLTGVSNGNVWGTDDYWGLSTVPRAAVHAGIVDVGESAIVDIVKTTSASPYTGTLQNGVQSSSISHGSFGSFSLTYVEPCTLDAPGSPQTLVASPDHSSIGDYILSWEPNSTGEELNDPIPEGYLVLENGVSLSFPETRLYEDTSLLVTGKPNGTYFYEIYACNDGANYHCSAPTEVTVVVDHNTGPMPRPWPTLCSDYPPAPLSVGAMTLDPGTYLFSVDATTNYSVIGTDVYSNASSISKASIHAGVLANGSSGIVSVTISGHEHPYDGSTQYGITSDSYASEHGTGSYTISFVDDCIDQPPEPPVDLVASPSASIDGDYTLTWDLAPTGTVPEGYIVTENGVSLPFEGPFSIRNYADTSLSFVDKPDGFYHYEVFACFDGDKYYCSPAAEVVVTVGNNTPGLGPIPGPSRETVCTDYPPYHPEVPAHHINSGTHVFSVTGSLVGGPVYGTNRYMAFSFLPRAAIHAGHVTDGETVILKVIKAGDAPSYKKSTQNGVTSANASPMGVGRFEFEFVSDCLSQEPIPIEPPQSLSAPVVSDGNFTVSWDASTTGATPDGYLVFENGEALAIPGTRNYDDTFIDLVAKADGSYRYQILACDNGTEYRCSDPVELTVVVQNGPPDADSDGLPDDFENLYGFNPNDPSDALEDADSDGATNLDEYNENSNPTDFFDCSGASCKFDPAPSPNSISVPGADATSDSVGAIAASLDVNSSGNASYSIRLLTPTGTADLSPNLSLSYSSGAGNGLLGLGWSMSGVSAITRCRQTLVQDGVAEEVGFDSDDRFCLDGQRLVLANPADTYGADSVEYRTEIDSNRKIISYGTQGSGPSWFRVWSADGSVTDYGNTSNSQLIPTASNNSVLIWGRNRVEDSTSFNTSADNPINYTYINNAATSDLRLSKIEYAYGNGSSANAVVDFNYEVRPDSSEGYRAGNFFAVDDRLASIDVKNEGTTIRTYDLTYLDEQISVGNNEISKLAAISECRGAVCLPDTEFTWSDAGIDFGFASSSTALVGFSNYIQHAASATFSPMDTSSSITANVNGDGNRDLIWLEPNGGQYRFRVATSNGTTLTTDSYMSAAYGKIFGWSVTDFDQDGYSDFLVVTEDASVETLRLFLNKDQGGGVRGYDVTPITLIADLNYSMSTLNLEVASFTDINNDALLDVVYNGNYRLMEEDPAQVNGPYRFGSEQSFDQVSMDSLALGVYQSTEFEAAVTTTGFTFLGVGIDQMRYGADFNGDGLSDAVVPMVHEDCSGCETVAAQLILLNDGAGGFTVFDFFAFDDDYSIADLNRDGLPDILCGNGVIEFNDGSSLASSVTSPGITGHMLHSLIDYNLDGYSDFVYKDDGSTAMKVLLWKDDSFANPATDAITIANTNYTEAYGPAGSFFDINGDGLLDYVNFSVGVYLGEDVASASNSTKSYNLIAQITNGLGNEKNIEYSPLTDSSVYTRESDAVTYDWGEVVFDFISPRNVVSRLENAVPAYDESTGAFNVNAVSAVSYTYAGFKTQPAGRGSLGFRQMTVTDEQTGTETLNTYLQEFPFTGLLAKTESYVNGQSTALRETDFTYAKLANLNGADNAPFRPILTNSVGLARAADSIAASDQVSVSGLLTTTTSLHELHDTYGNVGKTTVTITGDGNTYTTVTENTHTNNTSDWFIGRLTSTKVTTSKTGEATVVREASFTYDSGTGLLATEVREPNNASFTLTTTYLRDSFGNRIRATESGSGVTSRYTRVEYENDGRYIDKIYNSLEQEILDVVSRNDYGAPTITSNINGVLTYTAYGNLGRQFFEGNDTGSWTESEFRNCQSVSCPSGASYREQNTAADGSEAFVYYDNLARPIRNQVKGFDGQLVSTDIHYDQSGRVRFTSNPYSPSASVLWNGTEYDVLGRATTLTDAANNVSTNSYSRVVDGSFVGMQVLSTNAEGQTKTTISDGLGLANEVTDDLGGRLGYEYDARGNLTKLISKGSVGQPLNIESVITYDLLGRRSSLDDPDQGIWNYEYNRFGEMTEQTDALNQSSEMTYDVLGRLLTRIDKESDGTTIEGNASWSYDNGTSGLGRVDTISDSVSDFVQVFNYDYLGRVQQSYTALGANGADGEYNEITTYDEIGRLFQQVDASNSGTQYTYNTHGYMEKILEATDTSEIYYTVEGIDAWGNVAQALLGNGLTETRYFHADTGLPDRIIVTNPLMATIQDNTYTFDNVGMLTNRDRFIESNGNTLSETFHYDELNRLTQATATGLPTQSFAYDITGNMTSKSDVGTYSYGAGNAGPHAVTSAGGQAYTYDNAGNMLTGGGRTVTYNTFRKPVSLSKGGHTTSFEYGPSRARYKRVDNDGINSKTTLYVGNVEFIEHSSGELETKRYIHDIAVVTESSINPTREEYLHKDSLGSIDVVTDGLGNVVDEMSFDAFGKRRNLLTFADLLEADFDVLNNLTTRGFTGHEMLDEVGAIHMNGRVYDPELGRFMSADPIVQDLSSTQNLNRYSYVLNSPLSFTDPSGFCYVGSSGPIYAPNGFNDNRGNNQCYTPNGGWEVGPSFGVEDFEGGGLGEGLDAPWRSDQIPELNLNSPTADEIGSDDEIADSTDPNQGETTVPLGGDVIDMLPDTTNDWKDTGRQDYINNLLETALANILEIFEGGSSSGGGNRNPVVDGPPIDDTPNVLTISDPTPALSRAQNSTGYQIVNTINTVLDSPLFWGVVDGSLIAIDILNTPVSPAPDLTMVVVARRSASLGRELAEKAGSLGFTRRISPQKAPFNSHGQAVFTNGRNFISRDIDSHSGGVWKMFNRRGRRIGTFDENLNRIGN